MGCSSTPGESRECSTSTQRERAPRVPMRLARGKRRPASIAVRQATSRVTVTAGQGHQHLSSAGQTEFANDCLMTFCEVTCVERDDWLVAFRNFRRCAQPESGCAHRPARRPTDPLRVRKSLKTGGRSGHAPPYQLRWGGPFFVRGTELPNGHPNCGKAPFDGHQNFSKVPFDGHPN